MDAAAIEQANRDRKALGLSLLPVPGAAPAAAASSAAAPSTNKSDGEKDDLDHEPASTLETREAQAYDNFSKVQKEKDAKRDREARAAAIRKARDRAQMNKRLDGKGIVDDDDDDAGDVRSWLKDSKKRQKAIRAGQWKAAAAEAKAAAAAQRGADVADVEVGHDAADFLDGDHVLTLKDRGVLDEGEADELEDIALKEREKLEERLKLKRKAPTYDPNDMDETDEGGILSKYDEDISGKKRRFFKLQSTGTSSADITDILESSAPMRRKRTNVDAEILDDAPAPPASDYLDLSEIKVKKPKKTKKSKSHRQRLADDDDVLFDATQAETAAADASEQAMAVDAGGAPPNKKTTVEDIFGDDEDLQECLAAARRRALKKSKTKPADIAKLVKQEASQSPEPGVGEGGIILDDVKGFVDALQSTDKDEPRQRKPRVETAVTAMDQDSSDEDEEMRDVAGVAAAQERAGHYDEADELTATGVEEEKLVSQGIGSTLSLLRDRGVISKDAARQGVELNGRVRHSEQFKADLRRHMAEFDEQTRQQRERDRQSGRLDRMSARERELWQQQQNTMREQHQSRIMAQLFQRSYQPNVELRYVDGDGRRLSAKEAFKELSHQFHGKGSGKGKTDKLLKRLAEEKRKMAESLLDVSQNVGMSSAATHQGKKRKEAGVRLA